MARRNRQHPGRPLQTSYFEDPLTKGDGTWPLPIAQVGPGKDQSVTAQFLLEGLPPDRAREIREAVERDLNVLVVDHWIPDQPSPWPYLELWAGSFGNAYAQVHWSLFPKDPEQWRRRQHRTTTEVSGSPGSAATATNYFRRRLRGSDLDLLRTHPLLQLLVETVRNDDELDLQLVGCMSTSITRDTTRSKSIFQAGKSARLRA